jgi:hypothetical protein
MEFDLPEYLCEKTYGFPEHSYGANKVTLLLNDGRRVQHVLLAWGRTIVKIKEKKIEKVEDLPFIVKDVIDVISEV